MNCLEEKILKDGVVKEGNVLKVDSFLNHQMDIELFNEMGKEWKKRFAGKPINKILTIEASGIGIACIAAQHFGVPVVFAKKNAEKAKNSKRKGFSLTRGAGRALLFLKKDKTA